MEKERVLHINTVEDGFLIRLPKEWIYELSGKIGEIGANSKDGVGFALARIWDAEPHWHETTREYYFVVQGRGMAYVGEVRVPLKPYDWLEIPLHTVHHVESKNGLMLLAITSPPWSKGDHHLVEKKRS